MNKDEENLWTYQDLENKTANMTNYNVTFNNNLFTNVSKSGANNR